MRYVKDIYKRLFTMTLRYPLTLLFIIACYIFITTIIEWNIDWNNWLWLTLVAGATLTTIAQQLYERYFTQSTKRLMLYGMAVLITILYGIVLYVMRVSEEQLYVVAITIGLIALVAFMWIPTKKGILSFEQTFIAVFKQFFVTVLFTGVVLASIYLVLFSIDTLIITLYDNVYAHVMNLGLVLFSPLFFLSQFPRYDARAEREEAVAIPKLLQRVLIYVLMPFVSIYTAVMILYIFLNIQGPFWAENALEPMIILYTVITIIVLLLVQRIDHAMARFFKQWIPKALLLIIILQFVASMMEVQQVGLTHGRYYVFMYGLFALVTGFILSNQRFLNYTVLAFTFLGLSLVSVIPPMDAFTVSRINQVHKLETLLLKNDMFVNEEIIPSKEVSQADQERIVQLVSYLNRMDYTGRVKWLSDDVLEADVFQRTFGFKLDDQGEWGSTRTVFLDEKKLGTMDISSYDRIFEINVYGWNELEEMTFTLQDQTYTLQQDQQDQMVAQITDGDLVVAEIDFRKVFDQILQYEGELSIEEATIIEESDKLKMAIVVKSADEYDDLYSGEVYVFVQAK